MDQDQLNTTPGSAECKIEMRSSEGASCLEDRYHRKLAICSIICGISCIGIKALINSVKVLCCLTLLSLSPPVSQSVWSLKLHIPPVVKRTVNVMRPGSLSLPLQKQLKHSLLVNSMFSGFRLRLLCPHLDSKGFYFLLHTVSAEVKLTSSVQLNKAPASRVRRVQWKAPGGDADPVHAVHAPIRQC